MRRYRIALLLILAFWHSAGWSDESGLIVIDDSEKGKTLGQLKPAYVDFGYRKAPHVPMGEIVTRYRKLILAAPDPEVRLKALHRLLNLEHLFAAEYPDGFMDDTLWAVAVSTYREWLKSHPGDKAEDQYRYQLARALDMLGKASESRAELEALVRRFPRSRFVTEAWFRIAERLYAERRYADAEAAYRKVLEARHPEFDLKARYMLAWALFKQERQGQALDTFVTVLTRPGIDDEGMATLRRDIYRISAIIASEQQGARTLQAALERSGRPDLAAPLYEALVALYEKKEAWQLAVSVAEGFIEIHPDDPRAPAFQSRKVDLLLKGRLPSLAWTERARYVQRYGLDSAYWAKAEMTQRQAIAKTLYDYLDLLARRDYARAQKARHDARLWRAAAQWLDQLVRVYPEDPRTARGHYLLAEALVHTGDLDAAIAHYDRAGYDYPGFEERAEAAYAGVVTRSKQPALNGPDARPELRQERVDAMLRFAQTFPADPRAESVELEAARELMNLNQPEKAYLLAARLAQFTKERERSYQAWKLAALAADSLSRHADAEQAYRSALNLISRRHDDYRALRDGLAAALYAQAEARRQKGNKEEALTLFRQVVADVPESVVRKQAQYDAAMVALELQRWPLAIELMEDFRARFKTDPLARGLSENLVFAYGSHGQYDRAAQELLTIAENTSDTEVARKARLQAVDYFRKAGDTRQALATLKAYISRHPEPFEAQIQARASLIALYEEAGQAKAGRKAREGLIQVEARGPHTPLTRTLAAEASWVLARAEKEKFEQIRLTVPLKASLKKKKRAMNQAVSRLKATLEYGVLDYTTAATHALGEIYRAMARDIMDSERPRGLSELELEQYTLLLEDQAFPFEEKAIELFETNAHRAKDGVFDDWVKASFAKLAEMVPGRYNKKEQTIDVVTALY